MSELQEKLDQICREYMGGVRRRRSESEVLLTPERGKLLALQRLLFNKNRRDCWAAVSSSAPLEVKRAIWQHESEEMIKDPRCGVDHYSLHVRRCLAVGLTLEEIEDAQPIPTSRACFYAWLHIARIKPWLEGLSASSILERQANFAKGELRRSTERWIKELGLTERDMEVQTANENADGDHADMMAEIFDKHAIATETREMVLRGARESLDINRAFTEGLAAAAELIGQEALHVRIP